MTAGALVLQADADDDDADGRDLSVAVVLLDTIADAAAAAGVAATGGIILATGNAALAKLSEQDVAAADNARAALEWIAGDQGLAFITQSHIQNFCAERRYRPHPDRQPEPEVRPAERRPVRVGLFPPAAAVPGDAFCLRPRPRSRRARHWHRARRTGKTETATTGRMMSPALRAGHAGASRCLPETTCVASS